MMISRVYSLSCVTGIWCKQWGLGIKGPHGQNWEQKVVLKACLWDSMGKHGEKVMKTRKEVFLSHTLQTLTGFLKSQSTRGFVINKSKFKSTCWL